MKAGRKFHKFFVGQILTFLFSKLCKRRSLRTEILELHSSASVLCQETLRVNKIFYLILFINFWGAHTCCTKFSSLLNPRSLFCWNHKVFQKYPTRLKYRKKDDYKKNNLTPSICSIQLLKFSRVWIVAPCRLTILVWIYFGHLQQCSIVWD